MANFQIYVEKLDNGMWRAAVADWCDLSATSSSFRGAMNAIVRLIEDKKPEYILRIEQMKANALASDK